MDRDREARHAAMILAQSEYERHVLGREVDDDDFEAGWQAALAYVRENGELTYRALAGAQEFVDTANEYFARADDGRAQINSPGAMLGRGGYVSAQLEAAIDAISPPIVTESSGCVFRDLKVSPPEKE